MGRNFSGLDLVLNKIDQVLKLDFNLNPKRANRPYPARKIPEPVLDAKTRALAIELMRINHSGEVCAQALYQGQAFISRNFELQEKFIKAASEERDHLSWCSKRLKELGGNSSIFNYFFYAGSFALGALAGLKSDQASLGFLAETEHQVATHLQKHINTLPAIDDKTHAILSKMLSDEQRHADEAIKDGAEELPAWFKTWMQIQSQLFVAISKKI